MHSRKKPTKEQRKANADLIRAKYLNKDDMHEFNQTCIREEIAEKYLEQYKNALRDYLNQQIKRSDLNSVKKSRLQNVLHTLNNEDLNLEQLQYTVQLIKGITHKHKGKDGWIKSCKSILFNPTSYNEINKLFDENDNLKNFKTNKP